MLRVLKRLNHRHVLTDAAIIIFSIYASLYIRLGWDESRAFLPILNRLIVPFLVLRLGTFIALGVYDIIWRYISMKDAIKLVQAILLSSVITLAASYVIDVGRLPRATFFIDTFLLILMMTGIRFARRLLFEQVPSRADGALRQPTLIYGAGHNGRTLANRFATDRQAPFRVIGFIDDNPQVTGRFVAGVKVLGTGRDLGRIIRDFGIREVVVAIHHPSGALLREVVQVCQREKIRPRLVPGLGQSGGKSQNLDMFRGIELSDLLNRPRKEIDVSAIRQLVQNRRVLVTGAGGSIGSELARQILSFNPSLLLLLDHSEFNLYQIDSELRTSASDHSLVIPLLVDIKDKATLKNVFRGHLPEVVVHAAAYKHVHLVESNPFPAILNNVMGTLNLLDLCEESDVDTFVLISTDKAVNPAGVMGATKRLCELMVTEAGQRNGKRYCAVRFGNVLGSSGSLIPLLRTQIENGEPLTITHKDMTRYFMVIPEAVSLVLKAATVSQPGDIAILRMGDPIKIVDIAKSLIALVGKSEEEVPIVFTGLRPGEKMFEELYLVGNERPTSDPDILILPEGDSRGEADFERLDARIEQIIQLAQQGKKEAVFLMNALVKSNYTSHVPAPEVEGGFPFQGGERKAPEKRPPLLQ